MKFLALALTACTLTACSTDEKPDTPEDKGQSVQTRVIYGDDNRLDLYQVQNPLHITKAASTAALVNNYRILSAGGDDFIVQSEKFQDAYRLCDDEPFAKQDVAAFCSGFFVGQDVMVTAGHCIRTQGDCEDTTFVFDFAMRSPQSSPTRVQSKQVYRCKSLVKAEVTSNGVDYAIVRVDRPVTDRSPLAVRTSGAITPGTPVFVVGHPAGLPTKVAGGSQVRSVEDGFFVANLDTYGGNSGSAVFNESTGTVEGILVRGEADFKLRNGCRVSNVCENQGCRGEDVTRMDRVARLLSDMGL